MFVYDIQLLYDGSKRDSTTIKSILALFEKDTSMVTNMHKSSLSMFSLPEDELVYEKYFFPFHSLPFEEGLKYMLFHLKQNDYRKGDWLWLIAKIEKMLKAWSYRWLSRADKLALIKSVLEAILVFWMLLSWILKGIINQIL